MLADLVGFAENNREPGHHIAQHTLQRQTDAHAGNSDACDQRSDGNAERLEGDHRGKEHHHDFNDANQEQAHRRLKGLPFERLLCKIPGPARRHDTDNEDPKRNCGLQSILHGILSKRINDSHRG